MTAFPGSEFLQPPPLLSYVVRAKEAPVLTRRQWLILNCLADQDEPLESVYAAFSEGDRSHDPAELLPLLFGLYEVGYVLFRQKGIRALGQDLPSRPISPTDPAEIKGDCADAFQEFRSRRDYLARLTLGTGEQATAAGVPLGIWVEMTAAGRAEWDRPEYADYWQEEWVEP